MYGGPALVQPLLPALIDVCLKVAGRAGRATRAGVGGSQDPSQVSIVETAKQPSKCVGHCAQLRFPVGAELTRAGWHAWRSGIALLEPFHAFSLLRRLGPGGLLPRPI